MPDETEWSHPEFALIARALHGTAGLIFPANRRASVEAGMRRTMAAAGISDAGDLRRAVAIAGETRDGLITELTIGETYFFREPGQFEFLRTKVLPGLRHLAGQRRLRSWSAGCATGEEAYSIAMVLQEAGWPGAASILATDLASARLAAARRARYTAWSMRGVTDAMIARYFERRGKQFILAPDIRQAVDFRVLNLASREYPSASSGVGQMDIIFCRNVLIYFDIETVAAIAERLLASLATGGWLFLGASDPVISEFVPCEVVLTGAGLAYRPRGTADNPWVAAVAESDAPGIPDGAVPRDLWSGPDWTPAELGRAELPVGEAVLAPDDGTVPVGSHEAAYDQGEYDAAAELAQAGLDRGEHAESLWIVLVRSLANRGRLAEASDACVAALDRYGFSAELTHLHGILLTESGHHAAAAAAARRALYLDPQLAVAHLALGDALAHTGDRAGARRAFTNAATLLAAFSADDIVPGADGAAPAVLLSIARFRLDALAGTAGMTR